MVQPIAQRYIGSPIKRSEDTRILTGHGSYVDDIILPGMLYAAFVRSPIAHGRITAVETAAAREAPGVVAVVTGEELEAKIVPGPTGIAAMMGGSPAQFTILCTDKVRLVGDPIVMVVAESRYEAEDACELVEVDYDELPAVASAEVAIDPDSPPIFEDLGSNVLVEKPPVVFGDVDGAFARADRVVTAHLRQHRHQNVPMEGRGLVASFDPIEKELTVTAATQGVHMVRSTMAKCLGLELEQVRVLAGDIGGSFGLKFGASREEVAVAALSKELGRPVKWTEDRTENLAISGQAREESFDVEAAVTNEGDISALKVQMLLDSGAYPGMGGMVDTIMQSVMPGPYKMEGLSFGTKVAITNKASYVAYRGPWAAETFVRERMINLIAAELGMDPLAVRLRNVVTRGEPPERMINGRSLAGVTARESLERIAQVVDVEDFRRRQQAAQEEGRYLGLGMATYIEGAPGPPRRRQRPRGRADPGQARDGRHGRRSSPGRCPTARATRPPWPRSWPTRWASRSNRSAWWSATPARCRPGSLAEAGPPPWPEGPRCTWAANFAPGCSRRPASCWRRARRISTSSKARCRSAVCRPAPSAWPRWPPPPPKAACPLISIPAWRSPSPTTAGRAAGRGNPLRRGRGRCGHGPGPDPPVCGRRGLWRAHQPRHR